MKSIDFKTLCHLDTTQYFFQRRCITVIFTPHTVDIQITKKKNINKIYTYSLKKFQKPKRSQKLNGSPFSWNELVSFAKDELVLKIVCSENKLVIITTVFLQQNGKTFVS